MAIKKDVKQVWFALEAWLKEYAPEELSTFFPGTNKQEIANAEKTLSIKFPEDIRTFYLIHDGQSDNGFLIESYSILPLKGVVGWHSFLVKEKMDEPDELLKIKTIGPVKSCWWNQKWIPIAYNVRGNFYMLDMDPAQGGNSGQIIKYWHDDDERSVEAASFTGLLQKIHENLKIGKYKLWDPVKGNFTPRLKPHKEKS